MKKIIEYLQSTDKHDNKVTDVMQGRMPSSTTATTAKLSWVMIALIASKSPKPSPKSSGLRDEGFQVKARYEGSLSLGLGCWFSPVSLCVTEIM